MLPTPEPLSPDALVRRCDPHGLPFDTTAELAPIDDIIGQDRAVEAVRFGIGIRRPGFNIYAFGPPGHGKSTTIQRFLSAQAGALPAPDAWAYVYGFEDRSAPRALRLPRGRATLLRQAMHRLVEELLVALPTALESEAHVQQRQALAGAFEQRTHDALAAVGQAAMARGLLLVREGEGLRVVPAEGDDVMSDEAFRALPEERQAALRAAIDELAPRVAALVRSGQALGRETQRALAEADRLLATGVVDDHLADLRAGWGDLPAVTAYLDAVRSDVVDHLELFRRPEELSSGADPDGAWASGAADWPRQRRRGDVRLRRYEVNVLVDDGAARGAPVVLETHPTLGNLVGRLEQEQSEGTLRTDHTLIKPGALHRANGGFLVIEADELLKQPYAWDALKRALRNGFVRLEVPGEEGASVSPLSLDPEPVPLDVKVILIGESGLYFDLHEHDPDFPELFKVAAEFGSTMPRTPESEVVYARFIAAVAARERLCAFDRAAVAAVVEQSARLAEDAERLSTRFRSITDLLREADFWALERGGAVVERGDVARAVAARERRSDRLREEVHELFRRHVVLLETRGSAVGQANAVTVVEQGDFAFGVPVRVTARVRMGNGEVVDIEREVELGGPIHSKGVLILSGFLGGHFLPDEPLAMAASLTFEQSYHGIDGDSASLAEICAILSALAELPLRQSLALTGSVNQAGDVQAVGGVNEKIEGFYDVCQQVGLNGEHGILIPAANVQHLMLREDVIEAVRAGRFQVLPVRHVDEAMTLLTDVPAGERGEDGAFPPDTVNGYVEDRLRDLAEKRREYGHPGEAEGEDPDPSE